MPFFGFERRDRFFRDDFRRRGFFEREFFPFDFEFERRRRFEFERRRRRFY